MKKWSYIFLLFLGACLEKEPEIPEFLPEINLSTAYPLADLSLEITGSVIATNLTQAVEYGIVWSEKPNATIADHKIKINTTNSSTRFSSSITALKLGSKVYVKGYVTNTKNETNYSNEFEVLVEAPQNWKRLGDVPITEGQFTGIASKIDEIHLTFLRLDQNNNWVQLKHFKDNVNNPQFTWQAEKFNWPQVSPREEPLFFTVNFSKDFIRPAAFLGGGYVKNTQLNNMKTYVKDFYWVYDTQNNLEPIPFGDGPIAHFTLNRNEYFLEENNTEKFWSYFAIEQFIKRTPFPKLNGNYHFMGASTATRGYVIAQSKNEGEVLLFEFNDVDNTWVQKQKFPGFGRLDGIVFTLKNKLYYGLGRNTSPIHGLNDIWEYYPLTDSWKFISNYPGAGNIKVVSGNMGDYAILFCGYQVRESSAGSEKYYNANDTWLFRVD